ncbi:MAG TPA: peptidoglycan DD-metalloendopeptidase family protein [Xanthomonadaceae bacterium]|nr:peptidoglycan DD-metalloendopeptidase family protein [Xanthomonadaceae bacterium]
MRNTGLPSLLACVLVLGAVMTGAALPAAAQDAGDAQRRLDRTRAELEAIAAQRRKLEGQRGAAARALRAADEEVGETSRELARLQREVSERASALKALHVRHDRLAASLERQKQSLAALLRAAYALGEDAPLKLLLAQDRVADGQRLLAYHGYLQRERARRIDQLAAELQALAALEVSIEAERVALEAAKGAQQQRLAELERKRTARAGTLAQLENRYRDRAEREQALGRDVASLERLLSTLREAAARAARERAARARASGERTDGPAPAAAPAIAASGPSVGGLGWPVAGTLLAGYGARMPDGRRSDGVLIAADAGTEVVAAADGRVVFADWMNGYGLILILDHGNDTMSLYAHNDALLRDVGDAVVQGDPVARVGSSGGQGRPALYFELRRNGDPVDPGGWLRRR